jgi:GNAT superfamily N-acetyltransferase
MGYLFSTPAFWSGDPGELQTYDYHVKNLYRRPLFKLSSVCCFGPLRALETKFRRTYLRGSNCIVLLAMLVQPDYRGRQIATRFIQFLKDVAARHGYRSLLGPFRPSGYGRYKEQTRKAHSAELFHDYCYATGPEGFPIDPWLRTLVQNGMNVLRPELRSMQVTRNLRAFEILRKTYRPSRWYRTSEHTWECGQTPTWYTNPFNETVTSVEPNLWGVIPVI